MENQNENEKEATSTGAAADTKTLDGIKGAFIGSLTRNNDKIKTDRALSIVETTHITYKRAVEDMEFQIKEIQRERDAMLDLSPTDANSLIPAKDFDTKSFVAKDIELGVKIRNLEIMRDIATARYKYLFEN